MNTQHSDNDTNFATIDDIINFYSKSLQSDGKTNNFDKKEKLESSQSV
jgi:hypothetical protein